MRAILHIGIHKTGTTSIQQYLQDHRQTLTAAGISFFRGRHIPQNHVELHTLSIRDDRLTPFKLMMGQPVSKAYRDAVISEINTFKAEAVTDTILFSAEGLSYLRFPDEFRRLRDLIGLDDVSVIAYKRAPAEWLASYAAEMKNIPAPPVIDDQSFAYVEPNTWLIDFDTRLDPFRQEFGDLTIIDYDEVSRRDGGVIPSFLRVLGICHIAGNDIANYRLNARAQARPSPEVETQTGKT
ncbi:hypothetical protein [Hyphomicrobium sp. MC1]|uniref:hypothetical protein n=1 Tax=Hyphomicrobium sp. (strain MC1) TaxID=717785 RepID=UPI000213D82F|nr:hypothetical protein [Hyphomicrobium sp. MC1]CCB65065.1 protein of unknown function [Hyphomicrobium sp. MC1]